MPRRPRSTLFPYTTLFRSLFPRSTRLFTTTRGKLCRPAVAGTSSSASRGPPCCAGSTATPSATSRRTGAARSEEHTSELQSRQYLVCRLLLEKQKHDDDEH